MKKLLLVTIVLAASVSLVSAAGISIRPQFGLSLGRSGTTILGTDRTVNTGGTNTKNENIYYSAGAGLLPALGIYAELNDNFAAGLDFGYLVIVKK